MASWKMDVVESNSQRMRWNDNQAIFSSIRPGFAQPVHNFCIFWLLLLTLDPCQNTSFPPARGQLQ